MHEYVSMSKISTRIEFDILNKILSNKALRNIESKDGLNCVYYHGAPRYFTRGTTFAPYFWNEKDGEKLSVSIRKVLFDKKDLSLIVSSILCSSLFYFWFVATSDCRHLNDREVDHFPFEKDDRECFKLSIICMSEKLMKDLKKKTRACRIERLRKCVVRMVLREGLNRQIRRMWALRGIRVRALKRTRVVTVSLGDLRPGEYAELTPAQLKELYTAVGL